MEAITPGKCAAIPAPAIMTSIPLSWACIAKSSTSFGVRWARQGIDFKRNFKFIQQFGGLFHNFQIGSAAHDDAYFWFHFFNNWLQI